MVAIRQAPPFTFVDGGLRQGLAVDLWDRVALDLFGGSGPAGTGLSDGTGDTRVGFILCDSIDEQEAAMAAGVADVVISPLTITAERMESYDFSQQYLASGLSLALPQSNAIDFGQATGVLLETLGQPTVAQAIVLFLGFNLFMAFLIR
ncbi:MAG: transporter substrate-binding domain-containing protein, partial [Pseudomonadota bacterium]